MTLISQFPFIERQIGFNEPVDPNRSVRANESVKKALIIPFFFYFPTRLLSLVSINLRYLYKSSPEYITSGSSGSTGFECLF